MAAEVNHAIVKSYLQQLRLTRMATDYEALAREAEQRGLGYLGYLQALLEGELAQRHEQQLRQRLKAAAFPYQKRLEDFDFSLLPAVPKIRLLELAQGAFLATDLDLRQFEVNHETLLYPSWDHEETYHTILAGKPGVLALTIPTLTDPSLAPPGEHLVIVLTLIPYDVGVSWREEKAEYLEQLMNAVEPVIPGLHAHLTFAEGGSPRTMERYTLNLTGAVYGWELSPEQVGQKRHVEHQTPIKGLLLSGHWTQPGAGINAVVISGMQTAQQLLGDVTLGDFLQAPPQSSGSP